MKTSIFVLAFASLVAPSVHALPSTNGVVFAPHAPYVDGGAVIESPQGGDYVYSNDIPDDGRRSQRLMLGKAPRPNFDLFSEKEEAALWQTREAMVAAEQAKRAQRARRVGHHAKRVARPIVNWPKVIVVGEKTCVPTREFAASSDWQKHLVCWDRGSRHVD